MKALRDVAIITALMLGLAGLAAFAFWPDDSPRGEIGTALAIERELHCEEDEDIVVSLAANGLPVAYCQQVIER